MKPHFMPTFFVSHGGGPWPFMDHEPPDLYAGHFRFFQDLPRRFGRKPEAILVISGHWEEAVPTLMTHPTPPMEYDYFGFPPHTYQIRYPAPGAPELAQRVRALLQTRGIPSAESPTRGFDHGVYSPLFVSFPHAEVPVLQLSMVHGYSPEAHLEIGRALAPLRAQGVVILGSGLSYHNLRQFGPRAAAPSLEFDRWLKDACCDRVGKERAERLKQWESAPAARACHPREDHLVPLFVAVGAAESEPGVRIFEDVLMGAQVSAYQWG